MKYDIRYVVLRLSKLVSYGFCLMAISVFSQVKTSIDSSSIKIGSQITYKIQVEADSKKTVIFPEGQSFLPLEMIESYSIDTLKENNRLKLVKRYGLTQFDFGKYTIPKQKVVIGGKTFYTNSFKVEVNTIQVDTTKQGLYDIKPIIEVETSIGNWWKYVLLIILILSVIGFLLYWFIWRKKPLSVEEEMALLPPYDRAKLALKKLDESHYLEHSELKAYYSELTFIIRKYLDEQVYDRALESTTDELISRLNLLKEANQIDISSDDIKNLESILKRADLVKFANTTPDVELAKLDRKTIDIEIDHVEEALPEPTEEEKLLDEQYREEQVQKEKRKKIILTAAISLFLLIATYLGFSFKYGFGYVVDTLTGDDSLELLEGQWVTSDYGYPPIRISTPEVLKRLDKPIPNEIQEKTKSNTFSFEDNDDLTIIISNTLLDQAKDSIDLMLVVEGNFKTLESRGAKNILSTNEKFTTARGAEGVKTFGTLELPLGSSDEYVEGKFITLAFTSSGQIAQQIILLWKEDDTYAEQIMDRVLNSVELNIIEE